MLATVDKNGIILGIFENKDLAIDSIHYTFRDMHNLRISYEGLKVRVKCNSRDGLYHEHIFNVRHVIPHNKLTSL